MRWATHENFQSRTIFIKEFLSDRAKNLYIYSSKGLKGPRALNFPTFPENFPFEKIVILPKISLFLNFFPDFE